MKAHAYTETYLMNTWSNEPVIEYTLNYSIFSVLKYGGPTSMSTTDPGKFQSELSKQMLKGTKVITNRLPFGVKSIDEVGIYTST